jgi:DNA processing protein
VGPRRDHFPRRNRIVVGWSRAVVIIEAAQRSGALITARLANDEGRDVLAVPAHPSHEGAAGSNQLLRDGAALVRGAEDVAEELRLSPPPPTAVTAEADPVLRALQGRAPVSLDELQQRSGIAPVALLSRLGALELSARVRRLPGNLYLGN